MKHRYLLAALPLLLATPALAQTPRTHVIFQDEAAVAPAEAPARALTLNLAAARAALAQAPPETQFQTAPLVLALPLPDGRTARFRVWQTSVMAPALAARFPEIQTFAGQGLDDPTATLRLDLTPAGLHGQILSAATGLVYLDPARPGDTRHYLSFLARDQRAAGAWRCEIPAAKTPTAGVPTAAGRTRPALAGPLATASGGVLRTYRLALAATGEYVAAVGGTVPTAMAAIVTTVNRVTGIMETELAVRLVLVAGNSQLIYLDPNTDPYTDSNLSAMLGENQANVDAVIGSANYDIGHVLGASGGGLANVGVVGTAGQKAKGASSLNNPVGAYFDTHFVAHEMGHQFGANHSFNGNVGGCAGNRSAAHAWEPGSGSTIMSYIGNCNGQNLAGNTDPFYHVGNYEELRAYILGTTPATVLPTANTSPLVSGPPSGLMLPGATPFKLTATATDAENDTLRYRWEELDLGSAGTPNAPQVANDNWPLFRSFPATLSPTRYFPQLDDLVNNRTTLGEALPLVSRRLTFKCRASDTHAGPAGVIGGVSSSDSLKLLVTDAAGPFAVTSPNTALTWAGNSAQTVTWSVAGTRSNGVNCTAVNVLLSTDGGYTYPTVLATRVPNSGTAAVRLPAVATTTARIMVEAADNYFFDISNANFTISSPGGCAPPTNVAVSNITNTGAQVSFAAAPGASSYILTTTPASTTRTFASSPATLTGLLPGTAYVVQVVSDCGNGSTSVAATASFRTTAPPLCYPPTELAISNRTTTSATLSFVGAATATSYTITTVPATTTRTVTASPVVLTGLALHTHYVVQVVNNCAGGTTAAASIAFRTMGLVPANDLCAGALPLTCGVPVTGDTESATATGDPTATCVTFIDGGGIFYALMGTGNSVTITTCGATTDFDTKLFVFTGNCTGGYTCVTGNDDTNSGGCFHPSTVTFTTAPGTRYLVFVSGYAGAVGEFGLLATCVGVSATAPAAAPALRVWPNPVGSRAALHLALPAPAATATLRTVLGQPVRQQSFHGPETEMPTAGLAAGIYLLTVQVQGQAPVVRRVVVE